jgi:hypothetical protein
MMLFIDKTLYLQANIIAYQSIIFMLKNHVIQHKVMFYSTLKSGQTTTFTQNYCQKPDFKR